MKIALFFVLVVAVHMLAATMGTYSEVKLDEDERAFCESCLLSHRQLLVFPSRQAYYPYAKILLCNPVPIRKGTFEAMHLVTQVRDCGYPFYPRAWTFSYVHEHRYLKEGVLFRNGTYYIRNGRHPGADQAFPARLSNLDYFFDRTFLPTATQLQAQFKKAEIFDPYKEMREKLEEHLRFARRLAGFALMG